MAPEISIVIVHWNTPEMLNDCLKSIFDNETLLKFEIVVVDNHSKQDISAVIEKYPTNKIQVIKLYKNIGFGPACNMGVEKSKGEYLLFVGPDVLIIRQNTIYNTLEKLKTIPNAGAFSCQLLNRDGTAQRHSFNFPRADKIIGEWWFDATNRIPYIFHKRQRRPLLMLQKVDMVIAHWLMVSRYAFLKAGMFPQNAFMFGDDIELNKALIDVGYANYVYYGEQSIHIGRQSTKFAYKDNLHYIVQNSVCKFAFRHYGVFGGCLSIAIFILEAIYNIIMTPIYVKKDRKKFIFENWRVIWHYLAYQWRPGYIDKMAGVTKL
ncbi:MAG: glycosyltransferase family 2 protein [Fibrobacter sp.]|nr:glycosyltransferase family 2 protein [Fibrobacter sp.]